RVALAPWLAPLDPLATAMASACCLITSPAARCLVGARQGLVISSQRGGRISVSVIRHATIGMAGDAFGEPAL
ncbi:MAG TPA: hypothetical protein VFP43_13610, partial [Mesorhizobium sp.]|nr:hypothetical protein [Mesorhizobium sp.]